MKQVRAIVDDVHTEVEFFRLVSDEAQRRAAHELVAFYVGSLGAEDAGPVLQKRTDRDARGRVTERTRSRKAASSRSMA